MAAQPIFVVRSELEILRAVGIGPSAVFSGSPVKIAVARKAADEGLEVRFLPGTRKLRAGWDSEEGMLAALLATAPGRCYILEAPEAMLETIHELAAVKPGQIY